MIERQKTIENKSFVGSRGIFAIKTFVLVVLLFFSVLSLQAHGIQVKLEKESPSIVVHARYHGSRALAGARVTVAYGEEKTNVREGNTDGSGNFFFNPDKAGNWIVTVDDLMGHRKKVTITLGEDFFKSPSPPAKIEPAPVKQESSPTKTREKRPPTKSEMYWYLAKAVLGVLLILSVTFIIQRWQKRMATRNPKNET